MADTVTAVTNIKHNDEWIDAGEEIEDGTFTDEEMNEFAKIGAIEGWDLPEDEPDPNRGEDDQGLAVRTGDDEPRVSSVPEPPSPGE